MLHYLELECVQAHLNRNLLLTGCLFIALALAGVVICALLRRRVPVWGYAVAALIVLALNVSILTQAFTWDGAQLNWEGKAFALATTVVLCLLWPGISMREFGFTLRQTDGSLGPALAAFGVCCAIFFLYNYLHADGKSASAETFYFQATMPGFEEETMWRGLFLVLLNRAFNDVRINFLNAPIGWGGIVTIILFGLFHSLGYTNRALHFSPEVFAITGTIGFFLVWVRERTGSLALPIVLHNVLNVGVELVNAL